MIFVTVGASLPFDRLIEFIDKKIAPKYNGKIIAQIHDSAKYIPKNIEFVKTIDKTEYEKYIASSDLVISHAGMGVILDCIFYNKKLILIPRDYKKKEHIDDHQNEICEYLKEKYKDIRIIYDMNTLYNSIINNLNSLPANFNEAKTNLILLKRNLSEYLSKNSIKNKKMFVVCSSGGHLRQILELSDILPEENIVLITNRTKTNLNFFKVIKINGDFTDPFLLIKSTFIAPYQILKYRPSIILTNGGGELSIPFSYLGKLLGAKVVFIETISRVKTKSKAARAIYPIANVFLVQWEKNISMYGKKAKYWGSII